MPLYSFLCDASFFHVTFRLLSEKFMFCDIPLLFMAEMQKFLKHSKCSQSIGGLKVTVNNLSLQGVVYFLWFFCYLSTTFYLPFHIFFHALSLCVLSRLCGEAVMPLFQQKIKARSCLGPLIVHSRWKKNKNGREYWVGTEVWD